MRGVEPFIPTELAQHNTNQAGVRTVEFNCCSDADAVRQDLEHALGRRTVGSRTGRSVTSGRAHVHRLVAHAVACATLNSEYHYTHVVQFWRLSRDKAVAGFALDVEQRVLSPGA